MNLASEARIMVLPLTWAHGSAEVRGSQVVLSDPQPYTASGGAQLLGRDDLVADLAAVGSANDDKAPRKAAAFVRRHGLLHHGPGSDRRAEPLEELRLAGRRVDQLLTAEAALRDLPGASTTRLREVRRQTAPLLAPYPDTPPMQDADRADRAVPLRISFALATEVSEGFLAGVETRVVAYPYRPDQYGLGLALQPRDLLGLAFARLAVLGATTAPLRRCKDPECGRWFVRDEGRRRYCPTGCADRKRDRETKQRNRRKAEGGD